jgi:hypothetical protein
VAQHGCNVVKEHTLHTYNTGTVMLGGRCASACQHATSTEVLGVGSPFSYSSTEGPLRMYMMFGELELLQLPQLV